MTLPTWRLALKLGLSLVSVLLAIGALELMLRVNRHFDIVAPPVRAFDLPTQVEPRLADLLTRLGTDAYRDVACAVPSSDSPLTAADRPADYGVFEWIVEPEGATLVDVNDDAAGSDRQATVTLMNSVQSMRALPRLFHR